MTAETLLPLSVKVTSAELSSIAFQLMFSPRNATVSARIAFLCQSGDNSGEKEI
jgi:hypothetical protein